MPQYPFQVQTVGAAFAANGVSAAAVIKSTPGVLVRVTISTAGSAGALTFNDVATVAGAATANQIVSVPFGSLSAGQTIELNWPCKTAVTLSAIPTGGLISIAYN